LGAEVAEVWLNWSWGAGNSESTHDVGAGRSGSSSRTVADQAVVVGLLDPLVDHGSRPGVVHVRAKNGILVTKCTTTCRLSVTASLGEKDWDVVALGHLVELTVSRSHISVLTAPLIGVQCEEINGCGLVLTAGKVVLEIWAKGGDISGRVTDRDRAVALLVSVGLHVAGSSLDIRSSGRVGWNGENLVTNEETGSVVELLESVHDGCEVIVLGLVPGWVTLSLC